jgi:hypothetical protein
MAGDHTGRNRACQTWIGYKSRPLCAPYAWASTALPKASLAVRIAAFCHEPTSRSAACPVAIQPADSEAFRPQSAPILHSSCHLVTFMTPTVSVRIPATRTQIPIVISEPFPLTQRQLTLSTTEQIQLHKEKSMPEVRSIAAARAPFVHKLSRSCFITF